MPGVGVPPEKRTAAVVGIQLVGTRQFGIQAASHRRTVPRRRQVSVFSQLVRYSIWRQVRSQRETKVFSLFLSISCVIDSFCSQVELEYFCRIFSAVCFYCSVFRRLWLRVRYRIRCWKRYRHGTVSLADKEITLSL